MKMAPKLIQHRLQLPLRIAAGLADSSCGFAQCARRMSVRLQSVEINAYQLDQMNRDAADDLTTPGHSKPQLVSHFAAVLLWADRTLFFKRGQVAVCQAQAGEASVVGE